MKTKVTETQKYYYLRDTKGIEIERWNKGNRKHMMILGFRINWLKFNSIDTNIAYDTNKWWTVYHV